MKKSLIVGLAIGITLGVTGIGLAQWAVSSNGTAGSTIGGLDTVEVSAVYGGEFLPGQSMPLKADVTNGNEIALKVTNVAVTGIDISAPDCKINGRFEEADGLVLQPGKTEGVTVGSLKLPPGISEKCMGAKVTASVKLTTAFGVPS